MILLLVYLFIYFLFGQQVVILSGSTTGAFKEQELFTADSWKQFALSTAMLTSAKLRLVSLIVKTQVLIAKKTDAFGICWVKWRREEKKLKIRENFD